MFAECSRDECRVSHGLGCVCVCVVYDGHYVSRSSLLFFVLFTFHLRLIGMERENPFLSHSELMFTIEIMIMKGLRNGKCSICYVDFSLYRLRI